MLKQILTQARSLGAGLGISLGLLLIGSTTALAQQPGEPSLGQREMRYIFVNGETVDSKENASRLAELVEAGQHRKVTGLRLPEGYNQIYPEDVEAYTKQHSGWQGFMNKMPRW
jgi:hypothetical protein